MGSARGGGREGHAIHCRGALSSQRGGWEAYKLRQKHWRPPSFDAGGDLGGQSWRWGRSYVRGESHGLIFAKSLLAPVTPSNNQMPQVACGRDKRRGKVPVLLQPRA